MSKLFVDNIEPRKVADYMYAAPFLTPEFCKFIIKELKSIDTWGSAADEKEYETQDIYLKEEYPDLYFTLYSGLTSLVFPKVSECMPADIQEPYSIFGIYYSPETQKNLKLHRDESHVSASIKLNANYEGAELVFPEQNFSNKDLEVGEVLIWPASITHPHECKDITKGEKYSLTIWTRFPVINEGYVEASEKRKTY
jgi:hypothetical protein